MTGEEALVSVVLPERIDRPPTLGPFSSARDALKFVAYAGVGALFVPWAGVLAWFPFLVAGFLLSSVRKDGRSPDRWAADFVSYHLRRNSIVPAPPGSSGAGAFRRLRDGRYVTALSAAGIPVTYLPPPELKRLFERFRQILDGFPAHLVIHVTTGPLASRSFVPTSVAFSGEEATPRSGYCELVRLLVHRRFRRRVHLILFSPNSSPEGLRDVEDQLSAVSEAIASLGVEVARLRCGRLDAVLSDLGFPLTEHR